MFGMWETTSWAVEVPLNSFELLVAGGALLICAAILLLVRRNSRVVLENSAVTEEFMAYMARIANGVENLQGLQMPNSEAITRDVLLRLQEMAKAKPNGKVREMPGVFSER
jgi:hypothetical protein